MLYHGKPLDQKRGFDSLHPLHCLSMGYRNVQVKCKWIISGRAYASGSSTLECVEITHDTFASVPQNDLDRFNEALADWLRVKRL